MLSDWPPGRARPEGAPPTVRSRHLLFVPGYDPDAHKRTRMLFVREFGRYARRFGLTRHAVSRIAEPGPYRLGWTVEAAGEGWATETAVEVLRWEDIVQADFRRPVPLRVALLVVGVLDSLQAGVMRRFFRFNWKFGGVILYPPVMVCLLALVAAGFGMLAGRLAGWSTEAWSAGGWTSGRRVAVEWLAGLAIAAGTVAAATPLFERWFVWHLLHDWVFNWQHGNGWRPDYEARVDLFAERLVEASRASLADEIMVFGHSSGSIMAVEIVARALERDPDLGRRRPRLVLLTVGSCLPLVALNPRARRAHTGIRRLATSPDVLWVEYQAPQDWMNFPGFNPARDLGESQEDCVNPVIRSARFAEIVAPETYAAIRYRPFRMHFQFLMANDQAGEYDFYAMACGPLPMAWRCLDVASGAAPVGPPSMDGPDDAADPVMQRRVTAALR